MHDLDPSRRRFLKQSGQLVGGAWLTANWPGIVAAAEHAHHAAQTETPLAFEFLTGDEARIVEAVTSRIIPSDDTPGAREARVVYFVDKAAGSLFPDMGAELRTKLPGFNKTVKKANPDAADFSALSEADQDVFLAANENDPFFSLLRFMTPLGMFAHPKYGSNYDKIGWKLMGFADSHAFVPPFGFYDKDYPGFEPYPGTPLAAKESQS